MSTKIRWTARGRSWGSLPCSMRTSSILLAALSLIDPRSSLLNFSLKFICQGAMKEMDSICCFYANVHFEYFSREVSKILSPSHESWNESRKKLKWSFWMMNVISRFESAKPKSEWWMQQGWPTTIHPEVVYLMAGETVFESLHKLKREKYIILVSIRKLKEFLLQCTKFKYFGECNR